MAAIAQCVQSSKYRTDSDCMDRAFPGSSVFNEDMRTLNIYHHVAVLQAHEEENVG